MVDVVMAFLALQELVWTREEARMADARWADNKKISHRMDPWLIPGEFSPMKNGHGPERRDRRGLTGESDRYERNRRRARSGGRSLATNPSSRVYMVPFFIGHNSFAKGNRKNRPVDFAEIRRKGTATNAAHPGHSATIADGVREVKQKLLRVSTRSYAASISPPLPESRLPPKISRGAATKALLSAPGLRGLLSFCGKISAR